MFLKAVEKLSPDVDRHSQDNTHEVVSSCKAVATSLCECKRQFIHFSFVIMKATYHYEMPLA
jgi:hypothetical protein